MLKTRPSGSDGGVSFIPAPTPINCPRQTLPPTGICAREPGVESQGTCQPPAPRRETPARVQEPQKHRGRLRADRSLARPRTHARPAGGGDLRRSLLNSAFLTAFRLPNLFRRLLGEGSLTAAFLPTLQEELHLNGRPGAYALLNKVVSWLAVVTGSVVALAMAVFAHSRWAGGLEEKWYLASDLTVILFPYLVFICVAAAFNATLNVFQHFTEPALSPIWLNMAMIFTLGGAGLHWADTKMGKSTGSASACWRAGSCRWRCRRSS